MTGLNGYKKEYWTNGKIMYQGNFINGIQIGYWEFHSKNGIFEDKKYFIEF